MYSLKLVKVLALIFLAAQFALGAQYHVAQDGSAGYTTVQSAIDAAKKAKDASPEIIIDDFGTYKEQVTIDTMSNLTLRSTNPKNSKKPTIVYQDMTNTHPHDKTEAANPNLKNTFDENGALRVMYSHNIQILGINVDGGGPYCFGYDGVWVPKGGGNASPMFSGNAALHLTVSGDVTVQYCELSNAYFGISFKDRNIGGIFANVNPSDLDSMKIVPNSGFGKTGNHLIENCRIHNNAWGMFFESSWDLGSNLRYNLIYNNYITAALRTLVKAAPGGADNEPGGAIFFKDDMLSPLAIYNNTFWHNYLLIAGHWRAGSQHLIFNNIYASPYQTWDKVQVSSYMDMDPIYINRTHNVVFSVQQQALGNPQTNGFIQTFDAGANKTVFSDTTLSWQPQIMNGFGQLENITVQKSITLSNGTVYTGTVSNLKVEGNRIIDATKAFPVSADVRWMEPHFKSTDTASADFLVPNWTDSLVNQFIVDSGWTGADLRDADGSVADLGAIPKAGIPVTETEIKPSFPLIYDASGTLTAMFDFKVLSGDMKNPMIKYLTLVNNVMNPKDSNSWSSGVTPIAASDVISIPVPTSPVKVGGNTVIFNLPAGVKLGSYAFIEMTIEGIDAAGNKVTSDVGFLPYRQLDYMFDVKVLDATSGKKLDTVNVGVPVKLQITPYKITSKNTVFDKDISPVDVKLSSNFPLLSNATQTPFTLDKVSGVTTTGPVVFTKVPTGGFDRVAVNGVYGGSGGTGGAPFGGISNQLTILPGDPAKVLFQDPPSNGVGKVSPGALYSVRVDVFDKYDNKVKGNATVNLSSANPNIGDVSGPKTVNLTASDTGTAWFKVTPTNGNQGDTFRLAASLPNGTPDNAKMVVDKNRAKFYLFYADSAGVQDLKDSLVGEVGDRLPVVIRESSTDGVVPDTGYLTAQFVVTPSTPNLQIFASATDAAQKDTFTLVNGKARIWVSGTAILNNERLDVTTPSGTGVRPGYRENIYFKVNPTSVDSGIYYSDNGNGQVNRLELFYKQDLDSTKLPDSLELYWPEKVPAGLRLVKRDATNMKLDPSNHKHITVTLPQPFPEGITTFTGSPTLGTAYSSQGGIILRSNIKIHDGVNPLLASAILLERISQTGNDTMFVRFTETVTPALLMGNSLKLIKSSDTSSLKILYAAPSGGDTIKIIVQNAGAKSPAGGDKLMIDPAGPVRDQYGNAARPDNRPVVIALRSIPADVDSGFYKDVDGNGIVENATIHFKKRVNLANLQMVFKWRGNNSAQLNSSKFTYGADSSTVVANLANAFTVSTMDWTDQDMSVTVTYTDFPGQVRTGGVVDRAAPVLKTAELHPGKGSADGTWSKDELLVTFSEQVSTAINPDKTPYKFFKTKIGGTEYQVQLSSAKIINGGLGYSYLVDTIIGPYPSTGDSVQIDGDTPIISDAIGNFQTAKGNLKVALTVTAPKVDTMIVKLGPNPFKPVQGEKIKVIIDPLVKVPESVHLIMKFEIYDQLGNILYKDNGKESDNNNTKFTFEWNGRNLDGRNVGMGSYLLVIKGRDAISGKTLPTTQKMIGIIR